MMIFFKYFCLSIIFVDIFVIVAEATKSSKLSSEERKTDDLNKSFTVFPEFKAVLMYFSEAFLKGAKFGDIGELEGEERLVMPGKLVQILETLERETGPETEKMAPLKVFKEKLQAGLVVAKNIDLLTKNIPFYALQKNIAPFLKAQADALLSIHEHDGIIIPTGWVGHATVIVIKPAGHELYDLTCINTGEGLQHHYTGPDPDNVYPHLYKLWIEFKNIPQKLIFDPETGWFIYGLAAIKNNDIARRIKHSLDDDDKLLSTYFYGSMIANFKDYLVEPQRDDEYFHDRLVPEQQSGSCTMSSLMGALLYYSDSLKTFHWYRLKIGHLFLETFLRRIDELLQKRSSISDEMAQKMSNRLLLKESANKPTDFEFLSILTDGFFSDGSKHFYRLIGALANHQLQYLEHEFPEEFKHAGLMGSGRSTWIRDKKISAIEVLSRNESAKNVLQKTIAIAELLHEILSKITFRPVTTHIRDLNELHSVFSASKIYLEQKALEYSASDGVEQLKFTVGASGNIYQNIQSGKPERLEIDPSPIETFHQFYYEFSELYKMEDSDTEVYFMRFLNLFRRLRASPQGWELIVYHPEKNDLIELQRLCKFLALKFATLANYYTETNLRIANLDEITLLGHFQLLTWNLFKAIQNLQFPSVSVNWDGLIPPQTIQSALFNDHNNFKGNSISGFMRKFHVKGFNDIDNYDMFRRFLEDSQSESINSERGRILNVFPGPEWFSPVSFRSVDLHSYQYDILMKIPGFNQILSSFMSLPNVDSFYNELKNLGNGMI